MLWHETSDFSQFMSKTQENRHETPNFTGFVSPAAIKNSKTLIYAEDFGVLSCFIGEFSHPDFKQTLLFVLLHEIRDSQRNRPQQYRKNETAGDADMRTEIECDRRQE